MLLFIANLARGPFHGLCLGEGDFLDGGRAVVQASAVAVAVIALGIRASADVDHAALHRSKASAVLFNRQKPVQWLLCK